MRLVKAISILALSTAVASVQLMPSANAAPTLNAALVTADAGPLATQPGAARLLAKAQARGTVPVIVSLGVALSDQTTISSAQAASEAAALGRAQDGLLGRVLGGNTGGANVKRFDIIPGVALRVTPAQLQKLLSDPAVTAVQEDIAVPPSLAQSVPLIKASNLHTLGITGTNQIVAILDTGVQKTHSMIGTAKVVSEACYSTTNSDDGATAVCTPGSVAAGSGVNCSLSIAGCDHGTHVASIAAGNNASPVLRGVAPGAQIIAIQVFSRFTGANCGGGPDPCALSYNSDQILGLQRVFALRNSFGARKIVSVNMSLGGGSETGPCVGDSRQTPIFNLRSAGIAVAIASGNSFFTGSIGRPACVPGAIPVGSSLKADNGINDFSNHSAFVQLLAPGDQINAAQAGGTFGVKSGTSMATPHVAGAWALLRQAKPNASVSRILTALNCTGKLLGRSNIFVPRIDLLAARNEEIAADPTESFPFDTSAPGWSALLRTWSAGAGTLKSLNINNVAVAGHDYCSPSFWVSAQFKRTDPSASNFNSGIVVASRAVKSGTNLFVSGYLFVINKAPGTGNARVLRIANVNFGAGPGTGTLLCNGNRPTAANAYHTIRVDVINGFFRFYVDNTLVCSFTDYSFPPAKILTVAFGPTTGTGHHIYYNGVSITPVATASLTGVSSTASADFGPRAQVAGTGATVPIATQ